MIEIKNAAMIDGTRMDVTIPSSKTQVIDATGLTLLPALVDPHVHFRTPGDEYKENWETAAKACIAGGVTTVFDMPNTSPTTTTKKNLEDKKQIIDEQLKKIGIPLRYHLYFGADRKHFDEIAAVKDQVIGIKIYMASSTGELLMEDDSSLHAMFALAKAHNLVIAIHAEDEKWIQERKKQFPFLDYAEHSRLRSPEAAAKALEKAINLAKIYKTPLYVLHLSTKEELALIKSAKEAGISVFAETTPHHLLLSTEDYAKWGAKIQVNPPLRDPENHKALFDAIHEGIIDTVASDHAPHTEEEKRLPYGKAPSGIPAIELTLPLLLNAYHEGLLTLPLIASLTHSRALEIFHLPEPNDVVLVDLQKTKTVEDSLLHTKCGWTPYAGRKLKGWPVYTILQGEVFHVEAL